MYAQTATTPKITDKKEAALWTAAFLVIWGIALPLVSYFN